MVICCYNDHLLLDPIYSQIQLLFREKESKRKRNTFPCKIFQGGLSCLEFSAKDSLTPLVGIRESFLHSHWFSYMHVSFASTETLLKFKFFGLELLVRRNTEEKDTKKEDSLIWVFHKTILKWRVGCMSFALTAWDWTTRENSISYSRTTTSIALNPHLYLRKRYLGSSFMLVFMPEWWKLDCFTCSFFFFKRVLIEYLMTDPSGGIRCFGMSVVFLQAYFDVCYLIWMTHMAK